MPPGTKHEILRILKGNIDFPIFFWYFAIRQGPSFIMTPLLCQQQGPSIITTPQKRGTTIIAPTTSIPGFRVILRVLHIYNSIPLQLYKRRAAQRD